MPRVERLQDPFELKTQKLRPLKPPGELEGEFYIAAKNDAASQQSPGSSHRGSGGCS